MGSEVGFGFDVGRYAGEDPREKGQRFIVIKEGCVIEPYYFEELYFARDVGESAKVDAHEQW